MEYFWVRVSSSILITPNVINISTENENPSVHLSIIFMEDKNDEVNTICNQSSIEFLSEPTRTTSVFRKHR
uniref:Ovule protein n=1 Tax=Strongyloides venezuelensis TaxID=75913 RepID=A0A0K0F5V1_STRVS